MGENIQSNNYYDNREIILRKRYYLRDENHNILEDRTGMLRRVAKHLTKDKLEQEAFFQMMFDDDFLPNSPTLVNAGNPSNGCLSACFVLSPEDDIVSICDTLKHASMIVKSGGGVGFFFGHLRPKGDRVNSTNKSALGPIAVMNDYSVFLNSMTQAGSFRNAAIMSQLNVSHPDIFEFIHCKDNFDKLANMNISVQVTDEFMAAVENDSNWDLINPRNNEVVRTVKAREIWNEIIDSAHLTGDPGLSFITRVKENEPNPNIGIFGANPCLTGDSLIYTGDGLVPIEDLVGKNPALMIDSRNGETTSFASKVWCSGVKPVYKLKTKEGYSVNLTLDHKVFTENRGKVPAGELREGDKIRLLNHKGSFGREGDRNLGLVLGWLAADGHVDLKKAVLYFYGEKKESSDELSKAVQSVVDGTGKAPWRKYPTSPVAVPERDLLVVGSTRLHDVVEEYGLTQENWHFVPQIVFSGTEEMQRAYLQAIFGADGTVCRKRKNAGLEARLGSSDLPLLEGVQKLLLNFGIASRIYKQRAKERWNLMPDGKGGQKEYWCKEFHELAVTKSNCQVFMEEVGFLHNRKNEYMNSDLELYVNGPLAEKFVARFDGLEYIGDEKVYDLTEPVTHSLISNGIVVANCQEQQIENYNSCNLGSINLGNFVENGYWDWDRLAITVRNAVRFLNCVIDVNNFPLKELSDMNQLTRRIGLGVMGWADALVELGIEYESNKALHEARTVGKFINEIAWDESATLAEKFGSFPNFEFSPLALTGTPFRNSCVTSVAPTGTISRLSNCSFGIEPFFSLAYTSNILHEGDNSVSMLDCPKKIREAFYEKHGKDDEKLREFLSFIENSESDEDIRGMLESIGLDLELFQTASNISPEFHVDMLAAWQLNTSNGVSKTVNMENNATREDVEKVYLRAFKTRCKGITIYREGTRDKEVLMKNVDNNKTLEEEPVSSRDTTYQRPSIMKGTTHKISTGHGNMYVTVNSDDDGRVREIISSLGRSGGCSGSAIESVSRLVSLCLRHNINPNEVYKQLNGITCCPVWDNGMLVKSPFDAISKIVKKYTVSEVEEELQDSKISLSLIGGEKNKETKKCDWCGGLVINSGGCTVCLTCGDSKCG